MRNFRKSIAIFFMACTGLLVTSCFGSFELVRKVYNWNDEVVENKFVKTLLFYAMNIIPIYGVAALVDVVILNLVEFWSGSNPLAMNEGEYEERYYAHEGVNYKMTASKNQFEIVALDGLKAGEVQKLRFDNDSYTWYYEGNNQCLALLSFDGENNEMMHVHQVDGSNLTYAFNANNQGDTGKMYSRLLDMGSFAKAQ